MGPQTKYFVISNFCLISLIGTALSLRAQSVIPGPTEPFSTSIERRTAEQNLRSLPMRLQERRNQNTRDPQFIEQMIEDFDRIQLIRREMVREIAAGRGFALKVLEKDAGEIRKRAARLKDFLALVDNGKPTAFEAKKFTLTSINDAAFDLCIEISRFIENPIFKSNGVYTVRDASYAVRSLDAVINLAASISENAERLRKSR